MIRFVALVGLCLACSSSSGQLPQIRLDEVFPISGQAGKELVVRLQGGKDLDECDKLIFNHPGLTARANLTQDAFNVTVAADVPVGIYEVRAVGLYGVSNPRFFMVTALPRITEAASHQKKQAAQRIDWPCVVDARCAAATETDWYSVNVTAGQSIRIRVDAASMESLVQPVVEIFDESGRRIAKARRKRHQDAEIIVQSDSKQTLFILVRDAAYAGGVNHGYRMTCENAPAQIREKVSAGALVDTNLEAPFVNPGQFLDSVDAEQIVDVVPDPDGERVQYPSLLRSRFVDRYAEHHYRFQARQGDDLSIEVYAHRLGSPADLVLTVERMADENDQKPVRQIAKVVEGTQDPGKGQFPTWTRDPDSRFQVPEDGEYRLRIHDRNAIARVDAPVEYLLAVQRSQPSFRVVAVEASESPDGKASRSPGAIVLRKGGSYRLPLCVFRYAGHDKPIRITPDQLPDGLQVSPTVIPAGKSRITLTISASVDCQQLQTPLFLTASAAEESHPVTIASLMHLGANGLASAVRRVSALHVAVLEESAPVSVKLPFEFVEAHQNRHLSIPLIVERRNNFDGPVTVEFSDLPPNLKVSTIVIPKGSNTGKAELVISDKTPLGQHRLLLNGLAKVPFRRNPRKAEQAAAAQKMAQQAVDQLTQQLKENADQTNQVAKKIAAIQKQSKEWRAELAAKQQQSMDIRKKLDDRFAGRRRTIELLNATLDSYAETASQNKTEPAKFAERLKKDLAPANGLIADLSKLSVQVASVTKAVAELDRQLADGDAQLKQASAQQDQLKSLRRTLEEKSKAAESKLQSAKKVSESAAEAAKPKPVDVRLSLPSLDVAVLPAPATLSAKLAKDAVARPGQSVDVLVSVQRREGFAGRFEIKLSAESHEGLTATPVVIQDRQADATLRVHVGPDAKLPTKVVLRLEATTDFEKRNATIDTEIVLPVANGNG